MPTSLSEAPELSLRAPFDVQAPRRNANGILFRKLQALTALEGTAQHLVVVSLDNDSERQPPERRTIQALRARPRGGSCAG